MANPGKRLDKVLREIRLYRAEHPNLVVPIELRQERVQASAAFTAWLMYPPLGIARA